MELHVAKGALSILLNLSKDLGYFIIKEFNKKILVLLIKMKDFFLVFDF
jgi:hypothetical protein